MKWLTKGDSLRGKLIWWLLFVRISFWYLALVLGLIPPIRRPSTRVISLLGGISMKWLTKGDSLRGKLIWWLLFLRISFWYLALVLGLIPPLRGRGLFAAIELVGTSWLIAALTHTTVGRDGRGRAPSVRAILGGVECLCSWPRVVQRTQLVQEHVF